MDDLTLMEDEGSKNGSHGTNRVFYRCEMPGSPVFALTEDGVITSGLTLVHFYADEFDFVDEEVSMLGAEAMIVIPDSLEVGAIYEAKITNAGRDWESGHIESYDIEFFRVTDDDELSRIVSLREYAWKEAEKFMAIEESKR